MSSPSALNASSTVTFVLRNNSSIRRSIKVFNNAIGPGGTLDLMKIPGITEEDVRSEVLKGSLKNLLAGGSLQVVTSTVNFETADAAQGAFLRSVGISTSTASSVALSQATWYIDSVDGSDTNDGATSGTALKTFAELSNRWGTFNTVNPGPNVPVNIHILNDLPATDPVDFRVTLGPGVGIYLVGDKKTTIASGTFSAVTAKNRATNQALEVTKVGQNWADFRADGATPARIRDTTNGSVFFVAKDLGSGVARVSEPVVPIVDLFNEEIVTRGSHNPANPVQVGDAWVAERLTRIHVGNIQMNPTYDVPNVDEGVGVPAIGFLDFEVQYTENSASEMMIEGTATFDCFLAGCILQKTYVAATETYLSYCVLAGGYNGYGSYMRAHASLMLSGLLMFGSGLFIDMDTMFQGGIGSNGIAELGGTIRIGTACCFDITPGGNNPHGAGLSAVGNYVGIGGPGLFGDNTHALWGSGNAGAGVELTPGATVLYVTNAPTITGTGGDFKLANATSSRAWDETANAGAGGYTALISNTWAHLTTSIASSGLGDAAVNVGKLAFLGKGP